MFYFFRLLILYVAFFSAMAAGLFHFTSNSDFSKNYLASSTKEIIPSFLLSIRETQSGLLLAGMAAQNNGDWQAAYKNFIKLGEKSELSPFMTLRLMTLSLGNGNHEQALTLAKSLETSLQSKNKKSDEIYDLAKLMLLAHAMKTNDFQHVHKELKNNRRNVIFALVRPLVESWEQTTKDKPYFSSDISGLSSLEARHKALAASFSGQKAISTAINLRLKSLNYPEYFDISNDPIQSTQDGLAVAMGDLSLLFLSKDASDTALIFAQLGAYLSPNRLLLKTIIADIFAYRKEWDKALKMYAHIPETATGSYIRAQSAMAEIYMNRDDYKSALNILKKALKTSPDDPELLYSKARIYSAKRDLKTAISIYNDAEKSLQEQKVQASVDSLHWRIHYMRATAYELLGHHKKAEIDMLAALKLRPNDPLLLNFLGYSYANRKENLGIAQEMIEKALNQLPNEAFIIDSMGWLSYQAGKHDEAVEYLEKAAQLSPYNAIINAHLGDAYWRTGRKREAYYMWKRAIDYGDISDPEDKIAIDEAYKKMESGLTIQ